MDLITNYYEALVVDCIRRKLAGSAKLRDDDYLADVACVALNRLPSRYVRHIVDTRFFESEKDCAIEDANIDLAVSYALKFIDDRSGASPDGSAHFSPANLL
jgi:competence protein ComFB